MINPILSNATLGVRSSSGLTDFVYRRLTVWLQPEGGRVELESTGAGRTMEYLTALNAHLDASRRFHYHFSHPDTALNTGSSFHCNEDQTF